LGWFSPDYNDRRPASVARFEARISRTTLFAWVLSPARGAVTPPQVRVVSEDGSTIRLVVRRPGRPAQHLAVTLPDLAGPAPPTATLVLRNGNGQPQVVSLRPGEPNP
jgi:hypothetical protein